MVLHWWIAALPALLVGAALLPKALRGGIPTEAGELMGLLLWSFLAVLAWAWYLLGTVHVIQQAGLSISKQPASRLPSPRRLLDHLPALARAHGARLLVSLLALLPLGAALPLARLVTGPWAVRAVLGTGPRTKRWLPEIELVVVQLAAWILLVLLTTNIVVLLAWFAHGSLLDAAALLPRLTDPRLWGVALLASLSVVEPWRVLAIVAALGTTSPTGLPQDEETGGESC